MIKPTIAVVEIAAADCKLGPNCGGCKHNHYSAPDGQQFNRAPHSRCTFFARDIPMLLDAKKRWYGSEIPPGCPTFAQGALL